MYLKKKYEKNGENICKTIYTSIIYGQILTGCINNRVQQKKIINEYI